MNLLQRWILGVIIAIIDITLFNETDWQFWVIAASAGIVCSPLFSKE